MALSPTQCSRIRPVLINLILLDNHIPSQWSNSQQVAWLVLPAAWGLNLRPEIITTGMRETLTSALTLPQAGYLQIAVIELIPKGTGFVPTSIIHFVPSCVKHLPHI
jgi:hypothetical protein